MWQMGAEIERARPAKMQALALLDRELSKERGK
jgi:hypothetical protein